MRVDFLAWSCAEPRILNADFTGIGIEKNIFFIKEMTGFRIPRPIHPKSILEFLAIKIIDDHGKNIADLALTGKGNLCIRLRLSLAKKD
jgi:hypothetical protein